MPRRPAQLAIALIGLLALLTVPSARTLAGGPPNADVTFRVWVLDEDPSDEAWALEIGGDIEIVCTDDAAERDLHGYRTCEYGPSFITISAPVGSVVGYQLARWIDADPNRREVVQSGHVQVAEAGSEVRLVTAAPPAGVGLVTFRLTLLGPLVPTDSFLLEVDCEQRCSPDDDDDDIIGFFCGYELADITPCEAGSVQLVDGITPQEIRYSVSRITSEDGLEREETVILSGRTQVQAGNQTLSFGYDYRGFPPPFAPTLPDTAMPSR